MTDDEFNALWVKIALGAGLFLLLCVIAAVLLVVSVPPPTSIEESEYTQASAESNEKKTDFGVLASDSHDGCTACDANAKSAEQKRNEFVASKRDLNAQEGVWRASNAMAYLTALATIIGVVGLYLLNKTLAATQETLKATHAGSYAAVRSANAAHASLEITRDASRAVLVAPRGQNLAQTEDTAWPATYKAFISASNIGKTPAKQCRFQIAKVTGTRESWKMKESFSDPETFNVGTIMGGAETHPDSVCEAVLAEDEPAAFVVRLTYQDIYGRPDVAEFVFTFTSYSDHGVENPDTMAPVRIPKCSVFNDPVIEYGRYASTREKAVQEQSESE